MHTYKFFSPIAITPASGPAFLNLLQKQQDGSIMPDDIAAFSAANKAVAMTRIQGPERYIEPSRDRPGTHTEIMMWRMADADENDASRMAILFMDIVPDGTSYVFEPRRWIVGANVQALFPYKMSCCPGLSAIATFRQQGKLQPVLLENTKFTSAEFCDLFKLNSARDSGLQVDYDGGILLHRYEHLLRRPHRCEERPHALLLPNRLKINIQ